MRILNDEEISKSYGKGYGFEGDAAALLEAQYQLDLKDIIEWGEGDCEHDPPNPNSKLFKEGTRRHDCPYCWRSFKERNLSRKDFLALPMGERQRILKEQANNPEIIAYYKQLVAEGCVR